MADPMGFTWLQNPMNMYAQNNAYGNMIAYQHGLEIGLQAKAQAAAQTAAYPQFQQLQKLTPNMQEILMQIKKLKVV